MREQVNRDDLARLPLSLDMSPFRFDLLTRYRDWVTLGFCKIKVKF